jgi:hypothetical protein
MQRRQAQHPVKELSAAVRKKGLIGHVTGNHVNSPRKWKALLSI